MPDLERELAAATSWLREQAKSVRFGEVSVKLVLHDGSVSRSERTIMEKQLPDSGGGHARRD